MAYENVIPVPQLTLDPKVAEILREKEARDAAAAQAAAVSASAKATGAQAPQQMPYAAPAPMAEVPEYQPNPYGGIMGMFGMPELPTLPDAGVPKRPQRADQSWKYAALEEMMQQKPQYESFGAAVKDNWGPMALMGVLSLLTNGRQGLAGVGQAGLDAMSGLSGAVKARHDQQQQTINNALKMQELRDNAEQRDADSQYRYDALGLQAENAAANRAYQNAMLGVHLGNLGMRQQEQAYKDFERQMMMQAAGMGGGFGMGGGIMPSAGMLPPRQPGVNLPTANNNPLNMRFAGPSAQNGGIQGHGNFAYFPTPEQGVRAAMENLQTPRYMAADGTGSIAEIAPMWVEGHGMGDTAFWQANPDKLANVQQYIRGVSQAMGANPNARLDLRDPATLSRLTAAMGQHEGYNGDPGVYQRAAYGQMPQQMPAQQAMSPAAQIQQLEAVRDMYMRIAPMSTRAQAMVQALNEQIKGVREQHNFDAGVTEKVDAKIKPYRDEAQAARSSMNDLDALDMLYKTGLKSGFGQEWLDAGGKALARLGIDPVSIGANKPETAEAFNNLVTQAVMNQLALQKGVQTEGDAQRAAMTWARVQNTKEGNLWINQYRKNLLQRKIDLYNFMRNEMKRNGGSEDDAYAAWESNLAKMGSVVPKMPKIGGDRKTAEMSTEELQQMLYGGNI